MAFPAENATEEPRYEEKLCKLLAAEKLPGSISEVRFEIGTDHVGDPAVRLFLVMAPQFQANFDREQARRKQLRDNSFELGSRIVDRDPANFPFVGLVRAE